MKKYIYTLAMALLTMSCNDWLDVMPKTNTDEAELFRNEQGFKEALTGAYIKMTSTSLYGRDLTYGFMDVLAQRYNNAQTESNKTSDPLWYSFPSTLTEGYTNTFWKEHYNLIANLNNLLTNIETNGSAIKTNGYYNIIKGEALGLRAFLYLDLLRMYGPLPKTNLSGLSIPYRTQFDREVAKLRPASEVIDLIIEDLKSAETLLANDAMNISFPDSYTPTGFLSNRHNRMNKCAVKATLARAYLWKGDKVNAAIKAREVIEAKKANGNRQFALSTDNTLDKLGATELIFALNMDSETFPETVSEEFSLNKWRYYIILSDDSRLDDIFDVAVDGKNDMRIKEGIGFVITTNGAYTLKYTQENLPSPVLKNTMPLIRLPEMYYILAECSEDLTESAYWLSIVRSARGIEGISFANEAEKLSAIEKEYRKEFYAEGQLWYFYKRQEYTTFQFCPISTLTEANYRFPIPDDEVALGNIQ